LFLLKSSGNGLFDRLAIFVFFPATLRIATAQVDLKSGDGVPEATPLQTPYEGRQ